MLIKNKNKNERCMGRKTSTDHKLDIIEIDNGKTIYETKYRKAESNDITRRLRN